jgi:programmed cell death 6-interacting protein
MMLHTKFLKNFTDIFSDLLPITVHQAISNFEAQKGEMITREIANLRKMRQILNG